VEVLMFGKKITLLVFSIFLFSTFSDLTIIKEVEHVDNFKLKDYNGKEHSLSDYKDSKAIVIMFISTQCPVSNAYNSRMKDLYDKYKSKDVSFIGINANKTEDVETIKEHAEEHEFGFVILKDKGNKIADELDASVTPEIYVLNPSNFQILYHGRIDDSRSESNVTSKDLENALNEILSGKDVIIKRTKAFGCTIKRI
jgi:peroxiredoxin